LKRSVFIKLYFANYVWLSSLDLGLLLRDFVPRRIGTVSALSARPHRSAVTSFTHLVPSSSFAKPSLARLIWLGFTACEIKDFFAPFALALQSQRRLRTVSGCSPKLFALPSRPHTLYALALLIGRSRAAIRFAQVYTSILVA